MTTPMFQQYHRVKEDLGDELLFFRMGDFYEMFYEDAELVSKVLGLALTSRNNGERKVPMAGVPYHSATSYIKKLIKAGHKVAVCEQVEDPKEAKGLVKREVVRVITPGTLLEEEFLEEKKSNFLLAFGKAKRGRIGLSWLDLSTGEFFGLDTKEEFLFDEIEKISPSECLLPEELWRNRDSEFYQNLKALLPEECLTPLEDWHFDVQEGKRKLRELLEVKNLNGFGLTEEEDFLAAASGLIEYIQTTQRGQVSHIKSIEKVRPQRFMHLDMATQRTLEIVQTMSGQNRKFSLLGILDRTETAMGGRMLYHWVLHPLTVVEEIQLRQAGINEFVENSFLREDLKEALHQVYDLERLAAKVSAGTVTPRDLVSLRTSLGQLPHLKDLLKDKKTEILQILNRDLDPLEETCALLATSIQEQPAVNLSEGGVIKSGYSAELDEMRAVAEEGEEWLEEYEKEESKRTNIPSLKVSSNKVFGYYIEVTHTHGDKVPDNYIRKQTLKNAERYITPELKEYEEKVLTAREKAIEIEGDLFREIREKVSEKVRSLQLTARSISILDCLLSLAVVADEYNYTAPEVVEESVLEIEKGRHPVLERTLQQPFVPNDITMSPKARLFIVTGPNMAGKSTYIRQIALINLMAQMGSFVPATYARVGIADRLFTRLGTSDELYRGLSTFMVEMLETANILNNATDRSLVLLDEVGRGTSTFDGVSLAWAISEYLYHNLQCRTLFATHYHELTELPQEFGGMKNYSVAVKEWEDKIIFQHQIVEGSTDRSYGIHVAEMAGIPPSVIDRARAILAELETHSTAPSAQKVEEEPEIESERKPPSSPEATPTTSGNGEHSSSGQLTLFADTPQESKVLKALANIDINETTPLEAINCLKKLQDLARKN